MGMGPHEIIQILLHSDGPVDIEALIAEASIHLPRRGSKWIAAYRDEHRRRRWKPTGLRNREAALALAQRWEREASKKPLPQGVQPPKPTIRIQPGGLSQAEVAAIMRISERTVREIEKRALEKLRRHPALRELWREWERGEIREAGGEGAPGWAFTPDEMAAVYGLARTPFERQVVSKMIALTQVVRQS